MYKQLRKTAFHLLRPLPLARRRAVDRWLRAGHELGKLRQAEAVIVSYPKSGRTWVRAFLSAYLQAAFELATDELFGFDNYQKLDARVPRILFTHDAYFSARLDDAILAAWLRPRRPVLLVRDPRDTVVSSFYQHRYRMAPARVELHALDRPAIAEIDGFVTDPDDGLADIVAFYRRWAGRRPMLPAMPVIRYEDLKLRPAVEFTRLLQALGLAVEPSLVEAAVAAASFERMQAKEQSGALAAGGRFGAGETAGAAAGRTETFKVRQGRVGGYRESLSAATVVWLEQYLDAHMPTGFGYRRDEGAPGSAA